ncbi:MAG: hypothetical protein INR62_08345, partial [Rhodospirillales bacterium]|nr:hypothetical protein [Acetobacter sp.]
MTDDTTSDSRLGTLATTTLRDLRATFAAGGHNPSPEHFAALADIAATLEAMAEGHAAPKVYLSALDPGVGKTETLVHFLRVLLRSHAHHSAGVLVCVGRIDEAKDIAGKLAEFRSSVAVVTSDEKANALGGAYAPDSAQVLITTQQRIELTANGRRFTDLRPFYYRGGPRMVRVWDEAWLPGRPVTLNRDDILSLLKPIRAPYSTLAEKLEDLSDAIRRTADGDAVAVPDFEATCGLSLYDVLNHLGGKWGRARDDHQTALMALLAVNGRITRVRRDGKTGNAMLTFRDTLPADLAPLLVLDASARVRQTYRDIEEHRGGVVRLRSAVKDYSPLTFHVWRTSGSKSGFANNADALIQGIADAILTRPDERWLIVTHKPSARVRDIGAALRKLLPNGDMVQLQDEKREPGQEGGNVRVITWGRHMATNDFRDFPNVILAGTLFLRDSAYTALTHLAQGKDVADGLASKAAVEATSRGEYADMILQAVCRGRVRQLDGDRCKAMNAYIIASPQTGIPDSLDTIIFPGCRIIPWNAGPKKLPRVLASVADYLRRRIAEGVSRVPFKDIQRDLGLARNNFHKLVTGHAEWPGVMEELGLCLFGG